MSKAEELRIGDNLLVRFPGTTEEKFFTITAIDDVFYRDAHSALSASGTEDYAEVTNLDPPAGQLYWIGRLESDCNLKIYLKQPAATNRWGTEKSPEGGLLSSNATLILEGREIDVWIAEDFPPNVKIVNGTNVSITPVLGWIGKKFSVKKLPETPARYTIIKIGGLAE